MLHRLKRKIIQNAVMIYIFYNYVSADPWRACPRSGDAVWKILRIFWSLRKTPSNLLNVSLLFSYLLYQQLPYKYHHKYLALIIFIYIYYMPTFVT